MRTALTSLIIAASLASAAQAQTAQAQTAQARTAQDRMGRCGSVQKPASAWPHFAAICPTSLDR